MTHYHRLWPHRGTRLLAVKPVSLEAWKGESVRYLKVRAIKHDFAKQKYFFVPVIILWPLRFILGNVRGSRTPGWEPLGWALRVWIRTYGPGKYCMMSLHNNCPVVIWVYSLHQATHNFSIVFLLITTWAYCKAHNKALKIHVLGDGAGDLAVVFWVTLLKPF